MRAHIYFRDAAAKDGEERIPAGKAIIMMSSRTKWCKKAHLNVFMNIAKNCTDKLILEFAL